MTTVADPLATPAPELTTDPARRAPWDRFGRAAVMTVLPLALVVYLIAQPALALRWLWGAPFIGGFVEQTMRFNDVGIDRPALYPAFAAGVGPGDQLVAVAGMPVYSTADVARALAGHVAGESVVLQVATGSSAARAITVPLTRFPAGEFATLFVVPYLVGLVYIGIGLLVFWLRRNEVAGRAFVLFCTAAAVGLGGIFDLYTTHWFTWAWTLAVPAAGASLMTLGMVFPQEMRFVQRRPGLRLLPFVVWAALAVYGLVTLYAPGQDPRAYVLAWRYCYLFLGLGILSFVLLMGYRRMTSRSPIARDQSQIILIGAVLAFALLFVWTLQPFIVGVSVPLNAALDLPLLVLFPAAVAYALLRYRLLDTDYVTTQLLIYAGVAGVSLAAYGLLLLGVSLLVGVAVPATSPLLVALLVFALVVAFNPLRERLQLLVNNTFFRGQRAYRQRLEAFGRSLTRAVALSDIVQALDEQVSGALRPTQLYLFLRDTVNNDYAAYPELPKRAPKDADTPSAFAFTELRFAADGGLATSLAHERAALYLTPDTPLPPNLYPDRARLAVLGAAVYAPLPGQSGLAGWLALGPKLSGQPLTRDDLRFVEALADQAALAIERATVISDLERRVRDLNVLSQMSQAVNFTLNYDDLLELIYAQASKVVDTRNFYILLPAKRAEHFSYVFFVEDNERDNAQEQQPWPMGRGLESAVWRTGQPIRTDDYVAECRRRNLTPRARPTERQAWMGVPLNAGAATIGVLAVASFEADGAFTEDQLKIFWAIADQAASAMVKAQIFQKAEERAGQLAMLNEVSTTMAESLTLDPLLTSIVGSSMNILGCEAGSMFLTDDDTGEYVFRVAAGPVGQELIGMRLAPGKGFVGEAIESASVIIVNDVQNDPRWFRGSDQSTGFVTQALMVVPLRRGDRTIGALEVINKRNGLPFDDEDRNLLAAFAGQAAVAIENARLFAQTDQALADRVAELSVMQRIDRELNAALDVPLVMELTLDWAMKNTDASAGSVGLVTETGINIIATRGYGESVEQRQAHPLPVDRGIMGRVVRTGEQNLVRDVRSDPDYRGILAATRSQLTIPIVRERMVVGLINLESPTVDGFSQDQVDFVTRLLDHASVAITNARLYAEVNAANIAKSEFVSVAAHELKTPMTAIKMSAELMLAGAVGAVNDTQRSFLTTIKNNLDRMTTIVTDLNDITRIETGRLRLDTRAFDFAGVVEEVLRATAGLLEAKQQNLRVEIDPDLPPAYADSNRAAQVLTNLLSNANKYTPELGEVTLRVELQPPSGLNAAPQLHVAVQDTGIGISPEDQARLFQKFFRSEDRAAREMASGTGLGLNIVKNLVELQGGRIWLESEFRHGSTFHFTLPVAGGGGGGVSAPPAAFGVDKVALLGQTFSGLSDEELGELAALTEVSEYPPGYTLCREGAYEDTFYIVAAGEALTTKKISEAEGERVLRRVEPGDYVGEMALIQNAPRAATVRTLTACTVLEIDKGDFEAILSRSPRLAMSIIRTTLNRMRANDQVAITDLQKTNRVLAQLDRNKLEFIQVAAHELRTPLTIMKGYLNVIKLDEAFQGNDNLRAALDGLSRGTERLHEVVNAMLDVTRIDGALIAAVPVPLKSVVNDIARRLESEAEGRRLRFDIEHAPDTPMINADPTLIQKALYHVMVNAVKYTPDGGRILVQTRAVTLDDGVPAAQISVRDSGIGLDPEHHELIFEKFYQVGSVDLHSSHKTMFKGGGPGLGLAIARGVVRAHGGRIWVESAGHDEVANPGSTFFLQFPIHPPNTR